MHKSFRAGVAVAVAALVGSSLLVAGTNAGAAAPTPIAACPAPAPGRVTCFLEVPTGTASRALASRVSASATSGNYGPADLQKAYNLAAAAATKGGTVAIVNAYDYPKAESDLAVYRKKYGLPPCTTANGCFKKLNQNGQKSPLPPTPPAEEATWRLEITLDIQMVSAICPKCKIVLVLGNNSDLESVGAATNTASKLAHIVSHSYGTPEWHCPPDCLDTPADYKHFYTHAGVINTVASGDHGYGAGPQVPTSYPNVVAVGGTKLERTGNARGFTESAWSSAGSGCSAFFAKPAWQHDAKCAKRMIADVAAVGDPTTGVAVYNTYYGGWLVVGGTSAAAPIIASVFALAGNAASIASNASYIYSHAAGNLYDITTGTNGGCGNYRCAGKVGYDGPTGLGTPKGTGAF